MLPLDLPGIVVTQQEQDERTFTLHAGCEGRPESCPGCRSDSFIGHGQHPQEIIDLPHHGRFMAIQLVRKRYRCKACGNTFFHPLDWIDDDHRATRRFVDRVARPAEFIQEARTTVSQVSAAHEPQSEVQ